MEPGVAGRLWPALASRLSRNNREMLQDSSRRPRHTGRMADERIARLTKEQRDCLRLVHARYQIKQIAAELGIAVSTVNARLERARNTLGVSSSPEAARLHAHYEAGLGLWFPPTDSWNPMVIPSAVSPSPDADNVEDEPQDADAVDHVGYPQPQHGDGAGQRHPAIRWPFSTAGRTDNDIKPMMRLLWVPPVAAFSLVMLAIVALLTVAVQDILGSIQHSLARIF